MLQGNERRKFYKDIRIEDPFDIYFYHPLGYWFAVFFDRMGFSPTGVSVVSLIVGVMGCILFYYNYFFVGSLFIVFSSVFDSSDGQLARMKNASTQIGRIIDGLCGYVVFGSFYIVIYYKYKHIYGDLKYLLLMFIAGISNMIQSSVYDFYRTAFISVGKEDYSFLDKNTDRRFFSFLYTIYLYLQKLFIGKHLTLLKHIKNRRNLSEIKDIYEKNLLSNIQIINILGDNWKINGIILLVIFGRMDLFYLYVIIIINIVMVVVLLIQNYKDKFLIKYISEVV